MKRAATKLNLPMDCYEAEIKLLYDSQEEEQEEFQGRQELHKEQLSPKETKVIDNDLTNGKLKLLDMQKLVE